MQNFDISIAVGSVRRINANGKFFRYYNGSAAGLDETILVTYDGGSVTLKAGQSVKLNQSVSEWLVSNYKGQASILGVVVIGDGEITDTSIAGSVSVIDGGMARTLSNGAFLASGASAAVAAQYSHLQLWNPSGSGKNVILEAFSFSTNVASGINFYRDVAQRSTANNAVVSKYLSGAVGVAVLRSENNAVMQFAGGVMLSYLTPASVVQTLNLKEPIVIPPASGLNFVTASVNVSVVGNFEFFEQAI